MQQPYLSVILTSRNDGYAGGMLPRLQICVDSLLEQADQHQLELELVLVDWNPPATKAPLKDALDWSKTGCYSSVRVIEVPPEVHQQLKFSDKLPFLAHTARNVGIRRARGKFVLVTATDILFSESLIAYLAAKELCIEKNYRVSRHDVPASVIQIDSLAERLAFCEQNFGYVYRLAETGMYGLPLLHTYASGDFVLLSKENYVRLHGIPEEREFHSMHFDTFFCYMMYAAEIPEVVLNDPHRIYHMDHASFTDPKVTTLQKSIQKAPLLSQRRRNQLSWLAGKILGQRSSLDRLGVPYINKYGGRVLKRMLTDLAQKKIPVAYNDHTWGLGNYVLPESEIIKARLDEKHPTKCASVNHSAEVAG